MEDRDYLKETTETQDAELLNIDFKKLYTTLLHSRRRLYLWAGISIVVGIIVAFSIPKSYTVTSGLAPELSTSTSSKLGTITNMLGMGNLTGNTEAIYPSLYPKIAHSTPFVKEMLESTVTMESGQQCTLQDYMEHHTRKPWWSAALHGIGKLFHSKQNLSRHDSINPYQLTEKEYALMLSLNGMVGVVVDKKTMEITISTTAQDPHVAAAMCKTVSNLLKDAVTNYRTDKAKQTVDYYEKLYIDAESEYHKAQNAYAVYIDRHQGVLLQSVKVEQDRLQNEMNLKYQLYNQIATELQNSKAKVQLETPVFTEIVPPSIPLKPSKPKKKVIAALFLILGLAGGCTDILWWHKKESDDEDNVIAKK